MKRVSAADTKLYAEFLETFWFCWACGRTAFDQPRDWFGPWLVERAHIVSHPRIEARFYVNAICTLCHKRSHRDRAVTRERSMDWPPLTLQNMLWLKAQFDPAYFDLARLQKCAIGVLHEPEIVPQVYRDEYEQRRGLSYGRTTSFERDLA